MRHGRNNQVKRMLIICQQYKYKKRDKAACGTATTCPKHPEPARSTFLALMLVSTLISMPAVADDWLPPADSEPATEAPAGDDGLELPPSEEMTEAQEFATDGRTSAWRAWSDLYHEHGSKVRSSILGLSSSWSQSFGPQWQATANVDLDYTDTDPNTAGDTGWRLGLRELYLRHSAAGWWAEVGRINVRNGVATGYNPSDFMRAGAISAARTRDPQRLRESRLGAVQLRLGTRLADTEWVLSASPSIHDGRNPDWYDPRWGAVNGGASQHGLEISLPRWQGVFSQLLWQHRGDIGNSIAANVNASIGQAAIVYGEWARSPRPAIIELSRRADVSSTHVHQWAAGFSYTTESRITFGLEWQHNGAGLSRDEWLGDWQSADPAGLGRSFAEASTYSDPLSRDSVMVSMLWERFGHRNADLNCLWRRNQADRSHLGWCEWRYKGNEDEWSVAASRLSGEQRSEFGALGQRWSVALRWRHYW
ncbi:MAG: hypothetical protein Q4E06_03445 [Lautropia sp.]|nr:hypothetical protein [Lautropia sp.]